MVCINSKCFSVNRLYKCITKNLIGGVFCKMNMKLFKQRKLNDKVWNHL